MDKVTLFPPALQAVEDAVSEFDFGDLITLDWMYEHFDCFPPQSGSLEEFKEFQLRFLASLELFKNTLLENHSMALANVRGEGYRVLPPGEQTDHAIDQLKKRMTKEFRASQKLLVNIRSDLLSLEEKQKNVEAIANLAAAKSFTKKRFTFPENKKANKLEQQP